MAGIVSNIAGSLLDSLGRSASAAVELETADSKYVLAAKDGSLVTLLSVSGVASLVGGPEFDVLVKKIAEVLNTAGVVGTSSRCPSPAIPWNPGGR